MRHDDIPRRNPWQPIIAGVLLGLMVSIVVVHVAGKAMLEMTEAKP